MFDLTSSKLLILGVVALIVVGPKELPFLLRTIGKYVAMVRRHANEFRAQFDEAMREAELDGIKKELEAVARDTEQTIQSAQASVEHDINSATRDLDNSIAAKPEAASAEHTFDALNGLEAPTPEATPVPDAQAAAPEAVAPTPPPEPVPPVEEATAQPVAGDQAAPSNAPELAKTGS